ncbi:hypothetical protein NL676_010839 [Syzygium grande]|nr:hypothetical protein NL676_010839 [Syzygium grande]
MVRTSALAQAAGTLWAQQLVARLSEVISSPGTAMRSRHRSSGGGYGRRGYNDSGLGRRQQAVVEVGASTRPDKDLHKIGRLQRLSGCFFVRLMRQQGWSSRSNQQQRLRCNNNGVGLQGWKEEDDFLSLLSLLSYLFCPFTVRPPEDPPPPF